MLSIPNSQLPDTIGVWATTTWYDGTAWRKADQMGRPAINTVFNPSADKNLFNQTPPSVQRTASGGKFRTNVINGLKFFSSLDSEGAYADAQAAALADVLIPDVLVYSRTSSLPAPLNGRALADDVIDVELNVTTGGDPLGLFADRDATGAVRERRGRSAYRLPGHVPLSRPAALGRVVSEGGPAGSPSVVPGDDDDDRIQSFHPTRRPRTIGVLGATVLILVASYGWAAITAPSRPASPTGVAVGADVDPSTSAIGTPGDVPQPGAGTGGPKAGSIERIDHSIEAWSKNLAANAHDFISATNLATLFHGRGRLSYDLGDHERALAAARTALAIEPTHAPARALEAAILYTLHDFDAAFRGGRRPRSRRPEPIVARSRPASTRSSSSAVVMLPGRTLTSWPPSAGHS